MLRLDIIKFLKIVVLEFFRYSAYQRTVSGQYRSQRPENAFFLHLLDSQRVSIMIIDFDSSYWATYRCPNFMPSFWPTWSIITSEKKVNWLPWILKRMTKKGLKSHQQSYSDQNRCRACSCQKSCFYWRFLSQQLTIKMSLTSFIGEFNASNLCCQSRRNLRPLAGLEALCVYNVTEPGAQRGPCFEKSWRVTPWNHKSSNDRLHGFNPCGESDQLVFQLYFVIKSWAKRSFASKKNKIKDILTRSFASRIYLRYTL